MTKIDKIRFFLANLIVTIYTIVCVHVYQKSNKEGNRLSKILYKKDGSSFTVLQFDIHFIHDFHVLEMLIGGCK